MVATPTALLHWGWIVRKLTVKCHYLSYVSERVVHNLNDCFLQLSQAQDDGCPLILVYEGGDIIYQAICKKRFSDARRIMSKAGVKPILGAWVNGRRRPVESEAEIKAQAP
jgi:hypothetical protein